MGEIVGLHRVARVSRYRLQAKRRLSIGFTLLLVGAFLAASVLGSLALRYAMPQSQPVTKVAKGPEVVSIALPMCHGGQGRDCVIDGDTFRLDGQSIRIADIDTPETRDYGCDAEKALGDRATARMRELLNAGAFELQPYQRDQDQYGRKLRIVARDGQSLGQILVAEGLARTWDGARHPWC
jgi:endonuclease YncB( thermonuclease family)